MKRILDNFAKRQKPELLATFGGAKIVKHLNGKLEIQGGTDQEKAEDHAWMQQFLTQGPLTVRRLR